MYKIEMINNNITTIIHKADTSNIKILKASLKESVNNASTLSFSITKLNKGYDLNKYTTKVNVIDNRDNSILFDGRVIEIVERMDSNGFYKDIICESVLNFLQDTSTREYVYENKDINFVLNDLLSKHNEKVTDNKKIYLGNVNVTDRKRICITNFETTLGAIKKYVLDENKGQILIRKTDNKYYLDYLKDVDGNECEIRFAKNMKNLTIDDTNLCSRIIPVGKDNLRITNVNGGIDYLEDYTTINKIGVVEQKIEYRDIETDIELKEVAEGDLKYYTQPKIIFKTNCVDLSVLSNTSKDQFKINSSINVVNEVMGLNTTAKVTERVLNLLEPYNPTLTITNAFVKKTTLCNSFTSVKTAIIETNKEILVKDKKFQSSLTQTNNLLQSKYEELNDGIVDNTSSILQKADEIRLEVSGIEKKLDDKITINASSIIQLSNKIELKVSSKVYETDKNGLKSAIQSNTSLITQKADEINLSVNSNTNSINSLANRVNSAELKITTDAIITTVTNSTKYTTDIAGLNTRIITNNSSITQLDNKITSEVIRVNQNLSQQSSRITQTADKISLVVDNYNNLKGDSIVSAINLSNKKIEMKALNINLSGYVTVSALSGNGTTTINGSNIVTGEIDASRVTVKNLNASSITTGTITADRINGGTLDFSRISARNMRISDDLTVGDYIIVNRGVKIGDVTFGTTGSYSALEIKTNRNFTVGVGNGNNIALNCTSSSGNITLSPGNYGGKVIFQGTLDGSNLRDTYQFYSSGVKDMNDGNYGRYNAIEFKQYNGYLYFRKGYNGSWYQLAKA